MASSASRFPNEKLYRQLSVFLFLISGIYTIIQHRFALGLIFLFITFVLQSSFSQQVQNSFLGRFFGDHSALFKNILIWALWSGLCLTTLKFDSFAWAFHVPDWFSLNSLMWLQAVFFIGLVGTILIGNGKEKEIKDISVLTARVWFWVIFALAIVMRVYKMSSPEGSYGFDEAGGVMETRLVRDLQDYRQGYYIAYYQKPIFCYITLFLWHWLPNATDLLIIRLTAVLCDLGTVWLLYLTGKEVGGRRTGILAAAVGAVCKPLLNLTAMGMGAVMVPFFTLLPLLLALRLFKKPNLSHFLQLGFALGLGIYNNDYIRLELIFFIAGIFIWLLTKKENRTLKGPMGLVVLFNGLVLIFYYFYLSFGFTPSSWIHWLFDRWRNEFFIFMFFCALSLILLSYVPGLKLVSAKKNKNWIGAMLGLWICTLMDYPMVTRADYLERLSNLVNSGNGALSESLKVISEKVFEASQLLFWYGTWPANMGVVGDAFFGFGEVAVIFLGLAFFIAKPNWLKGFILFITVGGVLPHVFVGGTHNARVAGAVGPFILIAALGLNELLKNTLRLSKKTWFYRGALLLMILFWSWTAKTTYFRVYHQWFDQQILFLTSARNIAERETSLGRRIYFTEDIFGVESVVLNEGLLIHRLYPVNIIYQGPEDNPQDISVVIHDFSGGQGKDFREKVNKIFPEAVWSLENEVSLCRIPYKSIIQKRQNLFLVRDEPKSLWKREYIRNDCGLIFDLIAYEDRVPNILEPVGSYYSDTYRDNSNQMMEAVRYSTVVNIGKEGDYVINYKAANRSSFKIDGQTVLDLYFFKLLDYMSPEKQGEKMVHLAAGDHSVEIVTAFQRSTQPPEIFIRLKGAPAPGVSLWNSFSF